MPSPFPGMDPYLEDPSLWRGVNHGLIYNINQLLNAQLPPGYAANIDERLYIVQPQHAIYPDVALFQHPAKRPTTTDRGRAALAERTDESVLVTVYPEEITEGFIEIRTTTRPKRIVTIIEVVSPANKMLGSEGRIEYLQKQSEVLRSDVNLLEIDLLRQGAHTVAVPEAALREQGLWDYLVCLHRSRQRWTYQCWLISLRQRLPRVWVPLADHDPEILLDLQTAFNRCYDDGPYRREVDYRESPTPPLESESATWAEALLREKGLRS